MPARRKVDPSDLVGATEIAARLGVDRKTVHQWRHSHPKGKPPFPASVAKVERTLIWSWAEVERWAKATGRLE